PIKGLFSGQGLVGLVEQAIRVLRWGLWMAPIIYSFLRMTPDPTWYNQDGAVRTAVATVQSWHLAPEAFRAWSLQVFLGLLAYDWFRVLVWFDHMGLRVATLVNLSFVGGDIADERGARALGHRGRARGIPEGLRRFATWAPLLIPFYIPRGTEWDHVWVEAERMQAAAAPALLPPVETVLVGYALFAVGAVGLWLFFRQRDQRDQRAATATAAAEPPWSPDRRFRLSNGIYTLEVSADGLGYSRTLRAHGSQHEVDLTRRPDDPLQPSGKFLYLREVDPTGQPSGLPWSLGWQPIRHAGPDYEVSQPSPTSLRFVNSRDGVGAEALVSVAAEEALETWRIRLTNRADQPRTVELTSYRELALSGWDGYRRTPSYHALHVGTCFVRPLGAIIARNRLLKPRRPSAGSSYPFAREVAFHAVGWGGAPGVRLVGYQDARPRFLGSGTAAEPEALATPGRMRDADDEGLLYSFDPAASLRLLVDLPPNGSVELRFLDGYAEDENAAARLIARRLEIPQPRPERLAATFARTRVLDSSLRPPTDTDPPHRFSADGRELHIAGTTPRPWAHVMANALGHGAVVSDDGEIFSFAGNAQQNGLTPCRLDTVPSQAPAQLVYAVDLDTGRVDTPTKVPHRSADAEHSVTFGHGYAVFRKRRPGLELELTAFVPPDQPCEMRLLTIRNHGDHPKRYRVVPYLEMALAELPRDSVGRLDVRSDATASALFFSNPANEFRRGWAYAATSLACEALETNRARALGGPERDLTNPHLVDTGRPDAGRPDDGRRVASFVGTVEVPPGGEVAVSVVLGQAAELEEARDLAARQRTVESARRALADTKRFWSETLGVLRVETNRPDFDRLVNDWLPYQLLTARLWGRCGPNQRGGAFGFRDQLQDVLPLFGVRPDLARRQILLHARQQFLEGDVLQWWHRSPDGETGLGSRNSASDPHLWLPYLVARYVEQTGDRGVLDEPVPFLEGQAIPEGAEGINFVPRRSRDVATLYEHCRRAIAFALGRMGASGLPLIGSGDWNDGLSQADESGRAESVWLGFFLHDVLARFAELVRAREGAMAAAGYQAEAERLRARLQRAWDGDRYPRLVTGAGEALSWHDALMGSWPVLSGAVGFERGREAVEAALSALEAEHQVLLLTPCFGERSPRVPGRIADYPPGVRENGGQYSHGSSWLVDALAQLAAAARDRGDERLAGHLRARAFEVWRKISPLGKTGPELLDVYGLPPHQQPADIYSGPGYAGRGGWGWYTGAAARMLTAAHAILGLRLENGQLSVAPDAFAVDGGELRLRRVVHRGRVFAAA
ncbi:MAG TPA: hypothetical protein VFY87_07990, partial [Geminicoccaceae bacterium]|nr:hypothetical protein [Geminicoccaceae bacterium]